MPNATWMNPVSINPGQGRGVTILVSGLDYVALALALASVTVNSSEYQLVPYHIHLCSKNIWHIGTRVANISWLTQESQLAKMLQLANSLSDSEIWESEKNICFSQEVTRKTPWTQRLRRLRTISIVNTQ